MSKEEITKMQISRIEKEIRDTPYHKATEQHIGRLRAKLSKLKYASEESASRKKGGGGGYAVKKQGDATIVLIGPPSVGKSTLLNNLTNAKSKIAPYLFTTVSVIPGMLEYKDARIQILDVPGLIEGAEKGKGRGREVLSVTRAADLIIIMTDVKNIDVFSDVLETLENNGIRVNQTPPKVRIDKKLSGSIVIHSNIKQDLDIDTIEDVANEFGVKNAEITIKEKLTMNRLIDAFAPNRVYIPAIFCVNKLDLKKTKKKSKYIYISAEKNQNINILKDIIWSKLKFVRVYLVRRDEKPTRDNPIVMKEKQNLKDVALVIGNEFAEDKKRAVIWGNGAKFPGQKVSLTKRIKEGMQVRFIS